MRLFVAVELDDSPRRTIHEAQRRIASALGSDARRLRSVCAEHLHLTLLFLGEVAPSSAPPPSRIGAEGHLGRLGPGGVGDAIRERALDRRTGLYCTVADEARMPLSVLIGYVVGSVPFALLLAKRWGTGDLRLVGSGNVGAANVMRASGFTPGLLAAALDMSKGMASVLIAERLAGPGPGPAVAGLAAVVGHIYPVWIGFRGGKGVATACGVFAMLAPVATMGAALIFIGTVTTTRYVSLGSLLATVTLPPLAYLLGAGVPALTVACAAASLIVFRHRSNLARLWAGTEPRVGRLKASGLE